MWRRITTMKVVIATKTKTTIEEITNGSVQGKGIALMRQKYICVDNGLCETIVVFSEALKHSDFAMMPVKIVSAGFFNPETLRCFGKSVSLNLESRPQDTEIAQRQFKEHEL